MRILLWPIIFVICWIDMLLFEDHFVPEPKWWSRLAAWAHS